MNSARSFLRTLWQHRAATVLLLLVLLIGAFLAATFYVFNLPQFALDHQQTIVLGPAQFAPDNPASLRVVVRDNETSQPIANANVAVQLAPKGIGLPQTLYTGKTDARGTVPVAFAMPANVLGEQKLIIETDSGAGRDHIERAIKVQRNYKVLVTTDKPLYQPSQVIHLRALALGAIDRLPAKNQDIEFLIEDPKGNKIYRRTVKSSDYGIVSADFQLADTVNSGAYKITATLGDTKSEKTVTVKPYVLPKFKVSAETERNYYLPGEKVIGKISADYFFGKPVDKADVTIKGVVYDVARAESVNITGKTDVQGVYQFSFTLPNYFAGSGLNRDRADFGLEISVTDQANHLEQTSLSLPISSNAIMIDAVPESGKLVPGIENIVYVLTSLPDGSPLETDLTIANIGAAKTGKYGIAEVKFTPQRGNTALTITARDAKGRSASRSVQLQSETTSNQILLRPDHATYRVGETMKLDAFTSGSVGTVYLDIIKEKQTLSTRAEDIVNGRASISVDVTTDMVGTLQLNAYQVERDGTITRDTRIVVVEQPIDLNIAIKTDRDVYLPADTSKVTFSVTNSQGKGVQSALGVSGVDEAVFALAEQDPGFAKLYFLLQQELLDPKYQVKGFSLPEVIAPQSTTALDIRNAESQAANAAWAGAPASDFTMRANSQPEKRDAATKSQREGMQNLATGISWMLTIIPFVIGGVVLASLRARGVLKQTAQSWLVAILFGCLFLSCVIASAFGIGTALARLDIDFAVLVGLALVLAWLVALIVLGVYAIVKRDALLGLATLLLITYVVFVAVLASLTSYVSWNTINTPVIGLAGLVMLGAFALLGVGLFVQKAIIPSLASLFIAIAFLMLPLVILGPQIGNTFDRTTSGLTGGIAPAAAPMMRSAASSSAAPMPAPTAAPAPKAQEAAPGTTTTAEPPRLRQYFPETLYFNPQIITNENGTATIDIPLADSITTWRLAVTASSQRGELGSNSAGIRVFQDFFVDLDLPVALTQNDEISIPVAVYNYLPQSQKVKLQIDKQAWFTLQDDAEKTLTIASNDIDVVYFRIKAINFGTQKLKVTALGEKMSDAIQREIRVYPDGKQFEMTQSNWLKGDMQQVVDIPAQAIAGASRIEVKIYPGVMSQVVDGLDKILQMPFG